MTKHYAQDTILLGRHGPIHAGQKVPSTFVGDAGEKHDTDFDRLSELGLVGSKPPAKPAEEVVEDLASDVDYDALTVKQLEAIAEERNVDVPAKASKAELVELLSSDE